MIGRTAQDPGLVPAGWVSTPLDAVADVLISTVDKHERDDETPVWLCNYTDVYYSDALDGSRSYTRATASDAQIAKFGVEVGDVPVTKDSEASSDIGRAALVTRPHADTVYGYHLAIYRPWDSRYSGFLKWLFDSSHMRATLEVRTPGITRVGMGLETLRHVRVYLPQPDEAREIADYLDRETAEIDAFIADQERLVALLSERWQAHSAQVFGPVVGPACGGAGGFRAALVERDERVGPSPVVPQLSVSIHSGVVPASELDTARPIGLDVSNYKIARRGDVIVNRMRAFQGGIGLAFEDGFVSPDYAVLRVNALVADAAFLEQLIRSRPALHQISGMLRGIGSEESGKVRTPRVNVSDLLRMPVALPDVEEQRSIVARLDAETAEIDAAIADAREAIALSKERRAALITAAVHGQIDVTAR